MRQIGMIGAAGAAALLVGLEAAGAATLPEVAARGWVMVALAGDAAPFASVKDGKPAGLDVDLLDRLRRTAPFAVKTEIVPADRLLSELRAGHADLAVGGLDITPEGQRAATFGPPVAETGYWYLKRREDTAIRGIADLGGRRFAIADDPGSVAVENELEHRIVKAGGTYGEEIALPNVAAAADALDHGKVDYAVAGLTQLEEALAAHPGRFALGERVAQPRYAAWAVAKGNASLATFIADFVKAQRASGDLAALQQRWLGQSFPDLPDGVAASDWWSARTDKPPVIPIPNKRIED